MSKSGYKWESIQELPSNWKEMESETLKNLSSLWEEQKIKLNPTAISLFNAKLQRQWAIETGLLERLYELDKGITYTMIEFGIDAIDIPHGATNKPPAYVKSLIKDQQSVVEGLFECIKGNRPLGLSYIKEMHSVLTKSQKQTEAVDTLGNHIMVPLEKGKWKTHPNNPTRPDGQIHEYCPPISVQDEMDKLIQWHNKHVNCGVTPEVEAAWLHHRFTQIHPFQDGNGRIARALATLVFLQNGWFPLVITNENRKEYIDSLEKADYGDLKPLVAFFTQLAKDAFIRALSISETVISSQRTTENVLTAIQKTIFDKTTSNHQYNERAVSLADAMIEISCNEFDEISQRLGTLEIPDSHYSFSVAKSSHDTEHWFRGQIYKIGDAFDYYVNLEKYHKWVRLRLRNRRNCSIILSIHSVSRNFSGVMAGIMFLEYRENVEGYVNIDGPYALSEKPYLFTANDHKEKISLPFRDWVHTGLMNGLVMWQQKI